MLQSGLFFTLGFLCAALLALMVSPAIWRRAVVLTRKRIESTVPLSLTEIQADKDKLRAEFAMNTRRLEVSLDDLKSRAAEQLIDINKRRDEMLLMEEQHDEKSRRLEDLEAQATELRTELSDKEEKLTETDIKLSRIEGKLDERSNALSELEEKHRKIVDDFDDQKIEMVARETRMDSVSSEARSAKQMIKDQESEISNVKQKVKAANATLKKEKQRVQDLEKKIDRLQASKADMEGRLERRDTDLSKLREGKDVDGGAQIAKLEKDLDKANADKVKLQAEVAEGALRAESLIDNEHNDALQKQLEKLATERDELRAELAAVKSNSNSDLDTEQRENAMVRDRINDLAAQVAAMTASVEGPESPINAAIAKSAKKTNTRKKPASAGKSKKGSDNSEDKGTLADRIRALQAASEEA